MLLRRVTGNDPASFVIERQPIAAIFFQFRLMARNSVHQIKCDTLSTSAIRQVRDAHVFCHCDSLRGCFALTTIAEAGEAASLSGGCPILKVRT